MSFADRLMRAYAVRQLLATSVIAASVACSGATSTDPSPDPSTDPKAGDEQPEPPSPTSCGGTAAAGGRVSNGTFRTADEQRTIVVDRVAGKVTRTFVDPNGRKVVELWSIR
ncbi:MAG: hypothetical protein JST00_24200 [Deltaproteobacteria bacterium]|nr:hypothetical protein [Deltaproteobacteria bacterium]